MPHERVATTAESSSEQERAGVAPVNDGIETSSRQSAPRRGRPNLERAHKTLTSSAEAPAGAPRSGSA